MSDTGLGLGANVVLGLTEKCEVKAGFVVTFDNLFTSLPFLHELTELGIGALGTLQQSRCYGATIPNKTTLAEKPRGSCDFDADGKNMVMLGWITKLLLVPPFMLPLIMSAQLSGGQSQSRK